MWSFELPNLLLKSNEYLYDQLFRKDNLTRTEPTTTDTSKYLDDSQRPVDCGPNRTVGLNLPSGDEVHRSRKSSDQVRKGVPPTRPQTLLILSVRFYYLESESLSYSSKGGVG